jgi:2'-5' RNA ligase
VIRAFIAVRIDPAVARKISEVQEQLKRELAGVRWVGTGNLHFTLKFLGPIEEEKIKPVADALERALRLFPRFPILARGIGVFPDIRKPRVLWVGLEGSSLASLAMGVETALEPIGFAREKRGFKPHLTIGRWRSFNGQPELLGKELENWKGCDFGRSWVEEVIFFQSILKTEGATYHPLSIIRLSS